VTRRQTFSSRFHWNLQSNPLNDLLESKRRSGATILELTESNPTKVGLNYPEDLLRALAQPAAMKYEPHPRGLLVARQAVADYHRQRGNDVDVNRIHLTTSTSEGYAYLFKLLTDPGDNVLVPQPSYPLFEFLAGMEGVELRSYLLNYAKRVGWQIDFDSLSAAMNERTRAIVIVNPNYPTGSYVKPDELATLVSLCREKNLSLIFDEVFFDYHFDWARSNSEESHSPKSPLEGGLRGVLSSGVAVSGVLTFVLSGISKTLGLPQMKLGWIVVSGPEKLLQPAQEYLDLIADTYLSVSAPVQHAAPYWLGLQSRLHQQIYNRVFDNLQWLSEFLKDQTYARLLKVEGGWYATLEISNLKSEEQLVLNLLEKENVLIHPGFFFDFPREGFLVLSLLSDPSIFRDGLNRVVRHITENRD